MSDNHQNPTAALIIIGNEILSGRTQDTNLKYVAERLLTKGIKLIEVRVVQDDQEKIVFAINEVRSQYNYVFTTGGIGPTHDDITAESVAKAFGVPLELNKDAREILLKYYGAEDQLTESRLKMAYIPMGASLILNPVSGAPGFKIGNVHVMAGVPKIMQAMLDDVLPTLMNGELIYSRTVSCNLGESMMALHLTDIQHKYLDIEIGSYPQYRAGTLGVSLVARGIDQTKIAQAINDIKNMIHRLGGEITAEL
jgi:molybdenum cofactor synthesis domain-containing protein